MSADWNGMLGAWTFDPSRSDYGASPLPQAAIYTLVADGDGVAIWIGWTDDTGARGAAGFHVVFDGVARPGPSGLSVRGVVDEDAVITEAIVGGEVVQSARHVLGADGLELTVTSAQGGAKTVSVYTRAPVKQVIVYRRDLTMRKGKIAAQVAHASMKALLDFDAGSGPRFSLELPGPMAVWARGRFAKVVLSVEDEAALDEVYEHARALGLPAARITDAGRTEFKGVPTRTTVAVGPWTSDVVDKVTGPEGLVATKLA